LNGSCLAVLSIFWVHKQRTVQVATRAPQAWG